MVGRLPALHGMGGSHVGQVECNDGVADIVRAFVALAVDVPCVVIGALGVMDCRPLWWRLLMGFAVPWMASV